jgi:hypothetical protein
MNAHGKDAREAIERAKKQWNSKADTFNQWSELGQDEKYELFVREFLKCNREGKV